MAYEPGGGVTPQWLIERIAARHESKAKDLELRGTISAHEKAALIGHLRNSADLLREALARLQKERKTS